MQLIFLVIQIILAVAIIGAILLQRGSGDGLANIGGGGGGISGNSIVSSRTSASFITKSTTFLVVCFMINSLILGNLSMKQHNVKSVVEESLLAEPAKESKVATPQVPVSE